MAKWDTAYLLNSFKQQLGRPTTDREFQDARIYEYLTRGQDHWYRNIAIHVPQALWNTAPVAMVTTDGGLTYVVPGGVTEIVGKHEIRLGSATGLVLSPADYILEGVRLRQPLGIAFGFVPYIRYVASPGVIDGATAPTLKPDSARILIVYHALELAARKGTLRDPNYFIALQQKEWNGDPTQPGNLGILDSLKFQYAMGEAELSESGGPKWYRSPDLQ